MKRWNSRFVAYARAHGRTPEAQLAHDGDAYPGGRMCGFLLWVPEQWAAWAAETGEEKGSHWSTEQHARFDAWLERVASTNSVHSCHNEVPQACGESVADPDRRYSPTR